MRTLLFSMLFLVAASGCSGGDPAPEVEATPAEKTPGSDAHFAEGGDDFLTAARGASNRLRLALQAELKTAMEAGGPVAALEVCNTRAAEIATGLSTGGLAVRRVSTRYRNKGNEADAVEAAVLAQFDARPDFADTTFTRDGHAVYMKAIRVGNALCLRCHGDDSQLGEGVVAKVAELYPGDLATGFAEGDLRGAFVVTR